MIFKFFKKTAPKEYTEEDTLKALRRIHFAALEKHIGDTAVRIFRSHEYALVHYPIDSGDMHISERMSIKLQHKQLFDELAKGTGWEYDDYRKVLKEMVLKEKLHNKKVTWKAILTTIFGFVALAAFSASLHYVFVGYTIANIIAGAVIGWFGGCYLGKVTKKMMQAREDKFRY